MNDYNYILKFLNDKSFKIFYLLFTVGLKHSHHISSYPSDTLFYNSHLSLRFVSFHFNYIPKHEIWPQVPASWESEMTSSLYSLIIYVSLKSLWLLISVIFF